MRLILFLLTICCVTSGLSQEQRRILSKEDILLRSGAHPEWRELANLRAHGARLDLKFDGRTNAAERTLFITHDQVKLDWWVELNGKRLGKLFLMEAPVVHALKVPAGTLLEGENRLSIVPPKEADDIIIKEVALDDRAMTVAINQAQLDLRVEDKESGQLLPCRVTIVDANGSLAALHLPSDQKAAIRPGVVYTGNGLVKVGLMPGQYRIYANRGFEYGIDSASVSLSNGDTRPISLKIRREVPTPGLVACDTHIHTLTFSRHGDATADERALTIAGEGIELPIAAEHEYLADYSEAARKMEVQSYFTPVVGCETTTMKGHFNSFPVVLGSRVPDFRIDDWPKLTQTIRNTPGVRVLILNHPRNIHHQFQPFAATNFNAVTGENLRGFEFDFDAIEVVNSSALQSDWMVNFRDWFALLNYGYRITGLGSSDGHDVSRYIVGQGRTYISGNDQDVSKLDVSALCDRLLKGKAFISMGLLVQMTVDRRFSAGDLAARGSSKELELEVQVLGPSWVTADRIELFANGMKIRDEQIDPSLTNNGVKAKYNWRIPRPNHDMHLIALASGPGVSEPYWAISRPYQASSDRWDARVVGATNPIWVDGDADGEFTAARGYAKKLVTELASQPKRLLQSLEEFDEAVAAQVAGLALKEGYDFRSGEWALLLTKSSPKVRKGVQSYLETLRIETAASISK